MSRLVHKCLNLEEAYNLARQHGGHVVETAWNSIWWYSRVYSRREVQNSFRSNGISIKTFPIGG
jgi:hypothetical protein